MIYLSKLKVVEKDGYKYAVPYFPIGYIYISVSNENPTNHFGGTWVSFGAGKVLVGVDTSQTEFNTVEKTGGEKIHQLTVDEMPRHSHQAKNKYLVNGDTGTACALPSNDGVSATENWTEISQTGGGQAHNNLQPYITVYMFKKIA